MVSRYARLPFWARLFLALVCGAVGALGQAPHDLAPLLLVSLAAGFLLWQLELERTAVIGWAFGTGYFAAALFWIVEPFQVDAARHGWMAPFALVFLSAGLALFWSLAFLTARRISRGAFALVLTWTAAELLRAYIFTGFPWASPAQATINGLMGGLLAIGGPHVVTFLLFVLAWVLALLPGPGGGATLRLGQAAVLLAAVLALSLPDTRPGVDGSGKWVRVVQPNAAQHLKWQPDMAEVFLERQLSYTGAAADTLDREPDLIVWPETAIPWRLEAAQPVLEEIARVAKGRPVALGVLRFERQGPRNSMAVLGPTGKPVAIYDKHHLVPFGEYMPFASVAERLGLQALAATMGGFSKGPGPAVVDLGPLGKALPLICYEAVFPHDVNAMPERVDFLLQITNDAWFGASVGPQQHLAQARMRALEQGLPMVRAANTGVSALIDPYGRILASLPLNQAGFLDAELPVPLPPTLYSRTGDGPFAVLVLIVLSFALFASVKNNRRDND